MSLWNWFNENAVVSKEVFWLSVHLRLVFKMRKKIPSLRVGVFFESGFVMYSRYLGNQLSCSRVWSRTKLQLIEWIVWEIIWWHCWIVPLPVMVLLSHKNMYECSFQKDTGYKYLVGLCLVGRVLWGISRSIRKASADLPVFVAGQRVKLILVQKVGIWISMVLTAMGERE